MGTFVDTHRETYNEQGYTVIEGLFNKDEIATLRKRLIEVFQGKHDWPEHHFQVLDPDKHTHPDGGPMPIGVQRPAERDDNFRAIADHPKLIEAMENLLNGKVERYTDQALVKNPKVDGVSHFHQDSYYWRIPPHEGCNAWIALDTVGKDASALAMMPGTHRDWSLVEHEAYYDEPAFFNLATGKSFTRWRIPLDTVDFAKEALLPMRPGDAAFFTNYTWHRAEANRSGEIKTAYAVAYRLAQ